MKQPAYPNGISTAMSSKDCTRVTWNQQTIPHNHQTFDWRLPETWSGRFQSEPSQPQSGLCTKRNASCKLRVPAGGQSIPIGCQVWTVLAVWNQKSPTKSCKNWRVHENTSRDYMLKTITEKKTIVVIIMMTKTCMMTLLLLCCYGMNIIIIIMNMTRKRNLSRNKNKNASCRDAWESRQGRMWIRSEMSINHDACKHGAGLCDLNRVGQTNAHLDRCSPLELYRETK